MQAVALCIESLLQGVPEVFLVIHEQLRGRGGVVSAAEAANDAVVVALEVAVAAVAGAGGRGEAVRVEDAARVGRRGLLLLAVKVQVQPRRPTACRAGLVKVVVAGGRPADVAITRFEQLLLLLLLLLLLSSSP